MLGLKTYGHMDKSCYELNQINLSLFTIDDKPLPSSYVKLILNKINFTPISSGKQKWTLDTQTAKGKATHVRKMQA